MAHKSRAHRKPKTPKRVDRARAGFRKATGRNPQSVGGGSYAISTPKPLGREALPHYWHPDRDGVVPCPRDFDLRLRQVHPDLRIVRPPALAPVYPNCWVLWVKQPRIKHHLSPGWQLLMTWLIGVTPLPLDERIFAAIAHFDSRKLGENAVQYFDRIIAERDRARAARKKADLAWTVARAKEYMDSTKIKNIGAGNKFARHHDGTILPSRGERNWQAELDRHLPKDVRLDLERRRDSR